MKVDLVEKIAPQVETWEYLKQLPPEMHGFHFKEIGAAEGDKYHIFTYENDVKHCKIDVYYHHETKEYKLKVQIGLTDFCSVEYISNDLAELEKKLAERLELLMEDLVEPKTERLSCLVKETGVLDWEYARELPETIAGFQLFITPSDPVRTINGSYVILDYSNFAENSNFVILYNILREEFSAEMKFHDIPEITYDFDADSLQELEKLLKTKLIPTLEGMQQRLEAFEK